MEIKSNYITIPNVICNDKDLTVNSKYLYGWIYNEIYYGNFEKSMEDITTILNCSETTARKCLKQLKLKNYIKIEIIKGNTRKITPLVNDSMILFERNKIDMIQRKKEIEETIKEHPELIKETPQFVKNFVNELK